MQAVARPEAPRPPPPFFFLPSPRVFDKESTFDRFVPLGNWMIWHTVLLVGSPFDVHPSSCFFMRSVFLLRIYAVQHPGQCHWWGSADYMKTIRPVWVRLGYIHAGDSVRLTGFNVLY